MWAVKIMKFHPATGGDGGDVGWEAEGVHVMGGHGLVSAKWNDFMSLLPMSVEGATIPESNQVGWRRETQLSSQVVIWKSLFASLPKSCCLLFVEGVWAACSAAFCKGFFVYS